MQKCRSTLESVGLVGLGWGRADASEVRVALWAELLHLLKVQHRQPPAHSLSHHRAHHLCMQPCLHHTRKHRAPPRLPPKRFESTVRHPPRHQLCRPRPMTTSSPRPRSSRRHSNLHCSGGTVQMRRCSRAPCARRRNRGSASTRQRIDIGTTSRSASGFRTAPWSRGPSVRRIRSTRCTSFWSRCSIQR